MASVFRRGRSPYYYCRFANEDRYVRRSTKEKTEAAARKVADRWEAEAWLKQSGTDSIREEFLAWAAKRRIPELAVLKWLDERELPDATAEILKALKRLEAQIARLQATLDQGQIGR